MGVKPYGKGPLLWAGPLAARGQIAVSVVRNRLNFYSICIIYKYGGGPLNAAWLAVGWRPVL
jgi:hypothetical protein